MTLDPNHLGANLRQAALHVERGEQDRARQRYRKILDRAPHDPDALEQLTPLITSAELQTHRAALNSALKRISRPGGDRAKLHFGLARLAKQEQNLARFQSHLAQANAEIAAQHPYDPEADTHQTQAILSQSPNASQTVAPRQDHPRPTFITGQPRSGTTLTKAVLGAHPDVAALGERATTGFLTQPFLDRTTPFDLEAQAKLASDYLSRLPDLSAGTKAFSDKMPENYRYIVYLIAAFPDCRILCMRRDPRDVALSMWQAHFSGQALSCSYNLEAMAHRFNLHAAMQSHWQKIYPEQLMVASYKDLVSDIDAQSRRLAQFAGLGWSPAMARPDQNATPILSLSAGQVRQNVHQRSLGAWEKHEEMLSPFIQALDPELWPELL